MDSWHDEEDDLFDDALDQDNFPTWRFSGKDALIFLIDCSPKMHLKFKSEDSATAHDTPFKLALRCAHATLRNKIFANPQDEIGVLLFGTVNKVDIRDFDGLSLLLKIGTPEGDSILKLEHILEQTDQVIRKDYGGSSDTSYAVHEALWHCQAMFNEVSGKLASKTILLLTCNDDPHLSDSNLKKQAIKKAKDLQETGILLDVLAIADEGNFNMSKFYVDMLPDPAASKDDSIFKTSKQKGISVANSQKFEDLLRVVRKRIHKKRSVGKLQFDMGGGIVLVVSTYNLVQRM